MIKVLATIFSIKKDQWGEVKVSLLVPQSEAEKVLNLPTERVLSVTIEEENG